jgi:hypothetical protein
MELLLSYIAGRLEATPDTLLAGIQSNPSFLKAFCKLTLTPGITERSKAVRFAKRHAMRSARAFTIWEHDLSLVSGLDATAHAAEGAVCP